jgi:hypothetical protein
MRSCLYVEHKALIIFRAKNVPNKSCTETQNIFYAKYNLPVSLMVFQIIKQESLCYVFYFPACRPVLCSCIP